MSRGQRNEQVENVLKVLTVIYVKSNSDRGQDTSRFEFLALQEDTPKGTGTQKQKHAQRVRGI